MYTLWATMHSSDMTVAYSTAEAAMESAVDFVQRQAGTVYQGTVEQRWEMARRWWTGQGGEMEIVRRDNPPQVRA